MTFLSVNVSGRSGLVPRLEKELYESIIYFIYLNQVSKIHPRHWSRGLHSNYDL